MWNHEELESAIITGDVGEWDEPSLSRETHATDWSDFGGPALGGKPRWKDRTYLGASLCSEVRHRSGHKCQHCGVLDDLQIDHIKPRSWGGTDEAENLQLLCRRCNRAKGAKFTG